MFARRHATEEQGQSLVEFALVFPIFILLLMGTIEFGLVFNGVLALDYASRNAALLAAEAGNSAGADCVILESVEQDVGAPADRTAISTVQIYWADSDGDPKSGFSNVYTRGAGTTSCDYPDGSNITVPYGATTLGYKDFTRCNALRGCGSGHTGLDTIGVRITYRHSWRTPLSGLVGMVGTGLTIVRSNSMRMEPIL